MVTEQESDNSSMDTENSHSLREIILRPSYRGLSISDPIDIQETLDTESDSDCVVLSIGRKRKLPESGETSSGTSRQNCNSRSKKQCLELNAGKEKRKLIGGNNDNSVWCTLPQPLVVRIMLKLDHKSRLNMACTCKPWSQMINSACLWRSLNLELSAFKSVTKPLILYTKSHAKHIRNVVITWRRPSYVTSTKIHNGLTKILGHLKNQGQLLVFRVHYMELDRYWRFESRREKLLASISKFLEQQKRLKVFVMNSAQVGLQQGCRILESAAKHSGSTIKTLNMEDFFVSRLTTFRVPRYVDAMEQFTNITNLYINYNGLSEEIVERLANCGKLHVMSIKVYKYDPHFHRISGSTWNKLKSRCPHIEVNIEFDQVPSYVDIANVLTPQMPVRGLYIWSGYVEEDEWRLGDTLNHIERYFSKTLEMFTLEVENDIELIDRPLQKMVESCRKLHHVDINASLHTDTVDKICQLQQEGKISLQCLYITISGVPTSNTQEVLDEIKDKYIELIESLNLDFQFTADVVTVSDVHYIVPVIDVENHPDIIVE